MNDATPQKFIVQEGLTRRQKAALKKEPPLKHIHTRRDDGKILAYLEGWYVIAEANRIFGPENWDRITLASQCVWQGKANGNAACAYTSKVRICVRTGLTTLIREGSGVGQATGRDPGEAHGLALKAAETDATKRCLSTLGAPFGLTLYDKENPTTIEVLAIAAKQNERTCPTLNDNQDKYKKHDTPAAKAPWIAYGPTSEIRGVFKDPALCCSAIRRAIEGASSTAELEAIYAINKRTMARLHAEKPDLVSDAGQHYVTILSALFQARLKRYASQTPTVSINRFPEEALL
ncbi:MAG: Rad52/Rad22 family DNA repair protein [Parvibaculaceae bacterium]